MPCLPPLGIVTLSQHKSRAAYLLVRLLEIYKYYYFLLTGCSGWGRLISVMTNTSSSSPIHFLVKHSFGGGTWGTYWVLAFVVNPDDTVTLFSYSNGLTGLKSNLERLLAYPIVDKTTGWHAILTGAKEELREAYKKVLGQGYKPVKP